MKVFSLNFSALEGGVCVSKDNEGERKGEGDKEGTHISECLFPSKTTQYGQHCFCFVLEVLDLGNFPR